MKLARQVFTGIGLDIDRDFKAIYVRQAAELPRLVLAGQAAGLWGAGEGWPGFVQLAAAPGGARFLGPAPGQMAGILARYPLLKSMEVPAQTYSGIDRALHAVGSVNLIMARADLSTARAAAFVKAMNEAVPRTGRHLAASGVQHARQHPRQRTDRVAPAPGAAAHEMTGRRSEGAVRVTPLRPLPGASASGG